MSEHVEKMARELFDAGKLEGEQEWKFPSPTAVNRKRYFKLAEYFIAKLDEARREEREACCKDACTSCREGRKSVKNANGNWRHEGAQPGEGFLLPCYAADIRTRGEA